MPLWMFSNVPTFLDVPPREDEPKRDDYCDETRQDVEDREKNGDPDDLDNEGKNELYWIHQMDYEGTQLRKVYEATLKELWPDIPLKESDTKIGFFEAVMQCNGRISMAYVHYWLDRLQEGVVVKWGEEI